MTEDVFVVREGCGRPSLLTWDHDTTGCSLCPFQYKSDVRFYVPEDAHKSQSTSGVTGSDRHEHKLFPQSRLHLTTLCCPFIAIGSALETSYAIDSLRLKDTTAWHVQA